MVEQLLQTTTVCEWLKTVVLRTFHQLGSAVAPSVESQGPTGARLCGQTGLVCLLVEIRADGRHGQTGAHLKAALALDVHEEGVWGLH